MGNYCDKVPQITKITLVNNKSDNFLKSEQTYCAPNTLIYVRGSFIVHDVVLVVKLVALSSVMDLPAWLTFGR